MKNIKIQRKISVPKEMKDHRRNIYDSDYEMIMKNYDNMHIEKKNS